LVAVALEIGSEQGVVRAAEGFHLLEPARARNLLGQHAMEPGIDAMRLDRGGDERADRLPDRLARGLRERAARDLAELIAVPVDHRGNERVLAGEILIEGADAHAGLIRDAVGARPIEAFPHQNASSRFDQRIDRRARAFLRGMLAGIREWLAWHFARSECE